MVFKCFTLKLGNMRKAQDFVIYPYDGSDYILLQSDNRITRVNIRTGDGIMNAKHQPNGAYGHHLNFSTVPVKLSEAEVKEIQGYLWKNSGTQREGGRGVIIENAQLFAHTTEAARQAAG